MCIQNSHEAECPVEQRYAPTSPLVDLACNAEDCIAMYFLITCFHCYSQAISTLRPHVGQLALM